MKGKVAPVRAMKAYRSGGMVPLFLSDVSGQPENRTENHRER